MPSKDVPFTRVAEAVAWLKAYLEQQRLNISPNSVLSRMFDRCREEWSNPPQWTGEALRSVVADNVGAWFLAECVRGVLGKSYEAFLLERLQLLAKGDPSYHRDGIVLEDEARNLLFEVVCGCICATFAQDVRGGVEPDLQLTYRNRRIGIACKVVTGQDNTVAKRVREGVKQIGRAEGLDFGLVVLQCSAFFPHELMIGELPESDGKLWINYPTPDLAQEQVNGQSLVIARRLRSARLERASKYGGVETHRTGIATIAAVYTFQTVACAAGQYTALARVWVDDLEESALHHEFCAKFDSALQRIFLLSQ